MGESPEHRAIKEILEAKLKDWGFISITEYPSSGHELDVFATTSEGLKIYAEIIWTHTKTQFFRDISMLQQSDADIKLVVGSPEVVNDMDFTREFSKVAVSETIKGRSIYPIILDGKRILSDRVYVDRELKAEIQLLIEQAKRNRSRPLTLKKPKLDLQLVDAQGNIGKEIHVEPMFVRTRKEIIKISDPMYQILKASASMIASFKLPEIPDPLRIREPDRDLIPLGIEVSNEGETPAQGILISLQFPQECHLLSESQATGGLVFIGPQSHGGLYIDDEDRSKAKAWIRELGNDRVIRKFSMIHVRFPEREQVYPIKATIIQHNFPPDCIEFHVHVKPRVVEKIENVFEDELGKDES